MEDWVTSTDCPPEPPLSLSEPDANELGAPKRLSNPPHVPVVVVFTK